MSLEEERRCKEELMVSTYSSLTFILVIKNNFIELKLKNNSNKKIELITVIA